MRGLLPRDLRLLRQQHRCYSKRLTETASLIEKISNNSAPVTDASRCNAKAIFHNTDHVSEEVVESSDRQISKNCRTLLRNSCHVVE